MRRAPRSCRRAATIRETGRPETFLSPWLSLRAERSNLVPNAQSRRDCFVAALLAMILGEAMTPESARNIDFVAHHDLDGRGDGVQIMVHKGHAFMGHMFSDGFTIVDVRDPKYP